MTQNAFVFGDLSWPMPDLGLVAVWRAMPIDASRWADWDGFVVGTNAGTIGALVDRLGSDAPGSAPLKLSLDENGAKLRAYLEEVDADWWQRLAIAWRAAADLGASGEFTWVPTASAPAAIAYHSVIGDYGSRWEKRNAQAAENLAGCKEIDAMIGTAPAKSPQTVPVAIAAGKSGSISNATAKKRAPLKKPPPKKAAAKKATKKKR